MAEPKRMKMEYNKGRNKKNYYANPKHLRTKEFMEVGQRGFMATCNYREKDCIRDCYRILNEYADELYGKQETHGAVEKENAEDEEEVDISVQLQKETESLKTEKKSFRFQNVDTGASNCLFIKTSLPDPKELALKIITDIAETKKQKTKFVLRFIPVEAICKANIKDITETAGAMFDKHFLKEGKTFSIIYNKRYNHDCNRDEIIKELANMISLKNVKNKVDLKNPELSVIVEIMKGFCCLSIVPDYLKLKKFNLTELCLSSSKPAPPVETPETVAAVEETKKEEAEEIKEKVEAVEEEKKEEPVAAEDEEKEKVEEDKEPKIEDDKKSEIAAKDERAS